MCEVYNERGQMYYVHTTSWRGFTWTGREGLVCMHNTLLLKMLIKIRPDATVCRYLYTVKSLYMFQVPQHPSSGVLKFVTAASGTGHNTGTATSLQRAPIRPRWREVAVVTVLVLLMMGAVTPETCRVTLQ